MNVVENSTGQAKAVVITKINSKEIKLLTKANYWFSWRTLTKSYPIFKLTIEGQDDILGVIALADHPEENRIEIMLLASSKENVGREKKFEGIAACLIAYAASGAQKNYGDLACVSLVPKTALKKHYVRKYDMTDGGRHVYLDGKSLSKWAKKNL